MSAPQILNLGRDLTGRSWGEVVDVFLAGGVDTAATRRVYAGALKRAFAVMGAATIEQVTPYDLTTYRESIMLSPLAPATKRQQIAAVRSFLRWTRAFGLHSIGPDVVDVVLRVPPRKTIAPYAILTEAEIASLMAVSKRPRDRAMVMVLLGAGLRVCEVAALWMLASGRRGDVPVFRTRRGPPGRLHEPGVRCRLAALGLMAGIPRPITPHMLRHTYAVRALLHGNGNVMAISKMLGHRQLSTTQRYLDHLELPDLLASVPALPEAAG